MSQQFWNIVLGSILSFVGIFILFLLNRIADYLKGINTRLETALLIQAEHTVKLASHKEILDEHKDEIKLIKIKIEKLQIA